jgi:hypothetical protein
MKWGKDGQYDSLKEYLESDDGKESLEEFVKEIGLNEERKKRNCERVKKFFNGNQELFDQLMINIEKRHDDRWDNVCYKQGCEPFPWEILYAVFNLAEAEGTELTKPLDSLTDDFPSYIMEFMGWQFAITHGQGSVMSVYHNKILKFRI